MEQVKRNSYEFKELKKIIFDYFEKSTRKKMILLYSVKPAGELSSKVLLNKSKEASAFYDLMYQSLIDFFNDPRKKLFRDKRKPLYYFKDSAKSDFIEMPFELAGAKKKKLFSLIIV